MSEATEEKVEIQKSYTDLCFLFNSGCSHIGYGAINSELHL